MAPTAREQREMSEAIEAVATMLVDAVQATVDAPSPEPGRQASVAVDEFDAQLAPDDDAGPVDLIATLTLVRWLSAARDALADRPDRVDAPLEWIHTSIGPRYRARARYVSGLLESEEAAADVPRYRTALQADFLPAMVWLLAGVVAGSGGGRAEWLRELDAR